MSNGYYQFKTGRVAAIDDDGQHYCPFPALDNALTEPNGLIAIGGDLAPARLLSAYRQGIFPWSNYDPLHENDPIMWFSPNPRMVLYPSALKISQSLKKILKKAPYEVRFNSNFCAVITACSQTYRPDQGDVHEPNTWISPAMIAAYTQLHALGYAFCMESWANDKLVGGCYGVKIGRMFYGESMFYTEPNASKIAFVHLVEWLKTQQVGLIDCQMKTPLLTSFGGDEITRDAFLKELIMLL